jgi:hypothetical protein
MQTTISFIKFNEQPFAGLRVTHSGVRTNARIRNAEPFKTVILQLPEGCHAEPVYPELRRREV